MPKSRYELLDASINRVLAEVGEIKTSVAVLKSHQTDESAANSRQHAGIVKSIDDLVEQEKIRNGRLGKVEDRTHKLEVWRGWLTGAMLIGGGVLGVFGKALFDHITKH